MNNHYDNNNDDGGGMMRRRRMLVGNSASITNNINTNVTHNTNTNNIHYANNNTTITTTTTTSINGAYNTTTTTSTMLFDNERKTMNSSCSILERIRCQISELEAWNLFTSSLLLLGQQQRHDNDGDDDDERVIMNTDTETACRHLEQLPGGVQDAWKVILLATKTPTEDNQKQQHARGKKEPTVGGRRHDDNDDDDDDDIEYERKYIQRQQLASSMENGGTISDLLLPTKKRSGDDALLALDGGGSSSIKKKKKRRKDDIHHHGGSGVGGGQVYKAIHTSVLSTSLRKMAECASNITTHRVLDGPTIRDATTTTTNTRRITASRGSSNSSSGSDDNDFVARLPSKDQPNIWLQLFDERLNEIQKYHAMNPITNTTTSSLITGQRRKRFGNPTSDGYDIEAVISSCVDPIVNIASSSLSSSIVAATAPAVGGVSSAVAGGGGGGGIVATTASGGATANNNNNNNNNIYTIEEVMGKYLDFTTIYETYRPSLGTTIWWTTTQTTAAAAANRKNKSNDNNKNNKKKKDNNVVVDNDEHQYVDFLICLSSSSSSTATTSGTTTTTTIKAAGSTSTSTSFLCNIDTEQMKLKHRKQYGHFLSDMEDYLTSYISKTQPLLIIYKDVIEPAIQILADTWKLYGGIPTCWTCKDTEKLLWTNILPTSATSQQQDGVGVGGGVIDNGSGDDNKKNVNSATSNKNSDDATTTSTTAGGGSTNKSNNKIIDLSLYNTVEELDNAIDADTLKVALVAFGMKCGGTKIERAKRYFATKNTPLNELPSKYFVVQRKKNNKQSNNNNPKINISTTATPPTKNPSVQKDHPSLLESGDSKSTGGVYPTTTESTTTRITTVSSSSSFKRESRIDLARRETIVIALLDQVRPTLEATIRRVERKQIQTQKEQEDELREELYGGTGIVNNNNNNDRGRRRRKRFTNKDKTDEDNDDDDNDDDQASSDSDDDSDDVPVYNPKNVPLDWDGKPIPYWLFKLHGLNHYYSCEICGGEYYRGRRNFELHFADPKHSAGMKALQIPNTKHFHGITKIDDAIQLWTTLQHKLNKEQFDGDHEEEYEDSHGNVLSRKAYEDLARQGLL